MLLIFNRFPNFLTLKDINKFKLTIPNYDFIIFPLLGIIIISITFGCTKDNTKATSNEKYKDCCGVEPNVIILPEGNSVYVPNAFTPNGDGINDLFYPIAKDQDIKKVGISELRIYNMKDTVIFYRRDFSYTIDLDQAAWSGQMRYNIFNETHYLPDQKYEGGPFKYSFEIIYVTSDGTLEIKEVYGKACMIRCDDEVLEFQNRKGCFFPVQGLSGEYNSQIDNQETDCFK